MLLSRLQSALIKLNPTITAKKVSDGAKKVAQVVEQAEKLSTSVVTFKQEVTEASSNTATIKMECAGLTEAQRKKLRTTNMIEFQNKELQKLIRSVIVFPKKESLLRLVGAMLLELNEKWQSEPKAYLRINKGD